jgi:hypothetical protein
MRKGKREDEEDRLDERNSTTRSGEPSRIQGVPSLL